MAWDIPDVYYNSSDFGLDLVGEVEWSEEDYSFDLTAVWKDSTGQLYFGSDSGCSCPSPFEEFTKIEDLTKASRHEILAYLGQHENSHRAASLIEKVAAL